MDGWGSGGGGGVDIQFTPLRFQFFFLHDTISRFVILNEGRKEMFYLMTCSTRFIYGYMTYGKVPLR